MILRNKYVITDDLYDEALKYAELSKSYISNRHDFHTSGLQNKKIKMFHS